MITRTLVALLVSASLARLSAQQTQSPAAAPRLIRITNSFHPADGLAPSAMESVTLSIYRDERGGTPLWQETQNVNVDAEGRYSTLMGSSYPEGIPAELFSSDEPRWLGVQFNRPGETEQPRTQLVSVPYALRAVDAQTLGGLPASAYLRVPSGTTGAAGDSGLSPSAMGGKIVTPKTSGTTNCIGVFTDSLNLGCSVMWQLGSNIGIGITNPPSKLDIFNGPGVNTWRFSTGANSLREVQIGTRSSSSLNWPVEVHQPTAANSRMTLDLGITGKPTDLGLTSGVSWIDICSTPIDDTTPNYECLRLGKGIVGGLTNGMAQVSAVFGGTGGGGNSHTLALNSASGPVIVGGYSKPNWIAQVEHLTRPFIAFKFGSAGSMTDKGLIGSLGTAGEQFTGSASGDTFVKGLAGSLLLGANSGVVLPGIKVAPGNPGAVTIYGPTNYITAETGVNNAIAGTLSNAILVDDLCVTVKLAHSLQANGANTFALNGGSARPIVSHFNPSTNIARGYVATGRIELCYDAAASVWMDRSQ